jgi:hypothetical protein
MDTPPILKIERKIPIINNMEYPKEGRRTEEYKKKDLFF